MERSVTRSLDTTKRTGLPTLEQHVPVDHGRTHVVTSERVLLDHANDLSTQSFFGLAACSGRNRADQSHANAAFNTAESGLAQS